MCGRYVSPDDAAIEREFNLVRAEWQFPASFNVAPTDDVPVVRHNREEIILFVWGGITLVLLSILYQVWRA